MLTEDTNQRYSSLGEFLQELFGMEEKEELKEIESDDETATEKTADELLLQVKVGQEDFSPYDFMED